MQSSITQYRNEIKNKLISEAIYRVTRDHSFHIQDEHFSELGRETKTAPMNSVTLSISKESFEIDSQYYPTVSAVHATKKISYVHLVDEVSTGRIFLTGQTNRISKFPILERAIVHVLCGQG